MLSLLRYHFRHSHKAIDRIMLYCSLCCAGLILFHLGYNTDPAISHLFDKAGTGIFYGLFLISAIRTGLSIWANKKLKVEYYSGIVLFIYFVFILSIHILRPAGGEYLLQPEWFYLGIFTLTLAEVSKSSLFLDSLYFNPTILFVVSFLGLIVVGALLLMLPKSVLDGHPLRFVDAIFMATSAVCITGLSVVDIPGTFTVFGQGILLVLIQLGGLGIMTFTGFFGYFFSGGFSYKNQLMYGEIIGQQKVGSVINTLLKIIFVTLFVEAFGTVLLFFSVQESHFSSFGDHLFFALFHAVSAFCNAGFSTIEGGLSHPYFRFNYNLQLILVFLFISGGLGFTIVFNTYSFIKRWAINFFQRISRGKAFVHKAWVISFNSRLMAWSTLFLVVAGTLTTLIFEYNNTLAEHNGWGNKLIVALFTGNSARTSGFSLMDPAELSFPMIIIVMLLMWIGASPGSTGGGIKNTTFSLALLNVISLAKGKDHLEIFHRRISQDSVNKAFAIIMLSFLAIGISLFLLSFTDGHHGLRALAFEAFSAYATCGLSLGITPELSDAGKIIISMTMFVGRVGLLTLLVAMIKNIRNKSYTYPEEKVLL